MWSWVPSRFAPTPYGCKVWIFFFFNDTATTEIYTLSLHDALPIWILRRRRRRAASKGSAERARATRRLAPARRSRSEEHTSELQSPCNLVCRLLLEKKKNQLICLDRIAKLELAAKRAAQPNLRQLA